MKKRKRKHLAPWVVEQDYLIRWVLKKMPVRYKWRTMYIVADRKPTNEDQVTIFEILPDNTRKTYTVNIDNIDLLI